jgi:hypothetical protein
MVAGLIGFLVAFTAVLVLERFVQPRDTKRPIFHRVSMLSAMPMIMFYLSVFMLTCRPVFSTVFSIIVFLGIVVVNNAKFRELREPLVYSDFALLRQAIAYPALYVGYIGPFKVTAVILSGAAVIVGCLLYEAPVIARTTPEEWLPTIAYFATLAGLIYLITRGPLRNEFRAILMKFGTSANVREDVDRLSLVITLIFYFFLAGEQEVAAIRSQENEKEDRARPVGRSDLLPDIVVVQNESFFDARRVLSHVPEGFLENFCRTSGEARYRGRLRVPAWGANTLRTEFALLSGIPDEALGVDRFNPYLKYCDKPVWTIATYLRSIGYRTICIHPFHKSFFRRDKVYPHLGFDEFIDIERFSEADRIGPYVSDAAVTREIEALLADSERPVFIFAITMENHGPWKKGRIAVSNEVRATLPLRSGSFARYLMHLHNADLMIGRLREVLLASDRAAIFGFYGDHLPSMPAFFNAVKFDDPRTDYFIWSNEGSGPGREVNVSADALNRLLLEAFSSVRGEAEKTAYGSRGQAAAT